MDGTVPVSIERRSSRGSSYSGSGGGGGGGGGGGRRGVSYVKRAVVAASYPFRGIWFCLRHREFWPLFVGRLLPLSLISVVVYLLLFTFAFLPQYGLLALFHGWGAWINAVVLTLGEGLVIIQGLFEGFFVDECRVDLFDATLIKLGLRDLVSPHRVLHDHASDAVKMLGKPTSPAVYQPWSIIQIVELVVFLPLNFVPVVGTPAFIIITGTRLGKLSQYRWFQLRGLSKHERNDEIRDRTWDYVWFGTVAMILELIPVLSFFFLLTTTAGSAIWAARFEADKRRRSSYVDAHFVTEQQPSPPLSPQPSPQPPPYSDEAV
ncbi:hypothetical protein CDD83_7863 [Cordyceps sp. RAO-2017]|nr:hypothetical protein CDD83_7863 [Cordyceps sp. RAO-2017]